jgi:ABC-2 type transport system permease protein
VTDQPSTDVVDAPAATPAAARARRPAAHAAGFAADVAAIAGRAVRGMVRDPEAVIPAIVVAVFFYAVNVGALTPLTEGAQEGFSYKAFVLPSAVVFAVTGVSRAQALVLDIQDGYFDRLLLTPVRRLALLVGLMVADFLLVCALTAGIVVMGLIVGVDFAAGVPGMGLFVLLGGLWGLAFTGLPYAIALKTGNPAAVNSSFLLFFPFSFLTTSFVPKESLSGWLSTVADYNPVTYLFVGMRSLVDDGWVARDLAQAAAAILGVGVVSLGLALLALRGRVQRA